jgi:hypothetical protein
MKKFEAVRAAGRFLAYLESRGLTIETRNNISDITVSVDALEKPYLTPRLSPTMHDFTEKNSFWLTAYADGQVAAMVGARFDDIGTERFGDYLHRTNTRHHPHPSGQALSYVADIIYDLCYGRLVYLGDLFFAKRIRGERKQLVAFVGLVHALAMIEWEYDWCFAFVGDWGVQRGLLSSYGFSRQYPYAQTWNEPVPSVRSSEEWLVAGTYEEIDYLVKSKSKKYSLQT